MTKQELLKLVGQESDGVYVALKKCGCWAGVVSNLLSDPKWVAKEVASFIKDGYTITKMTDSEWRDCTLTPSPRCPHKPKEVVQEQMDLIA